MTGEGSVAGKWINDGLMRAEETSGNDSALLSISGTMINNGVRIIGVPFTKGGQPYNSGRRRDPSELCEQRHDFRRTETWHTPGDANLDGADFGIWSTNQFTTAYA